MTQTRTDKTLNEERLEKFYAAPQEAVVGKTYSLFVRAMRYGLPLLAGMMIFAVIAWPRVKKELVIIPKEDLVQQSRNEIGQNELLNPNFETIDSNNNPIKVTASRALQNTENPNLVRLENPSAQLQDQNGKHITVQALQGSYEQETEKLFLNQDVRINHMNGYQLNAEELRVDMKTESALSNKEVTIISDEIRINAQGLDANISQGRLIFKGPAKLTMMPQDNIETNVMEAE